MRTLRIRRSTTSGSGFFAWNADGACRWTAGLRVALTCWPWSHESSAGSKLPSSRQPRTQLTRASPSTMANPIRLTISPCLRFVSATVCNQHPARRIRRHSQGNIAGLVCQRWRARRCRSPDLPCEQHGRFRRHRRSAPQISRVWLHRQLPLHRRLSAASPRTQPFRASKQAKASVRR